MRSDKLSQSGPQVSSHTGTCNCRYSIAFFWCYFNQPHAFYSVESFGLIRLCNNMGMRKGDNHMIATLCYGVEQYLNGKFYQIISIDEGSYNSSSKICAIVLPSIIVVAIFDTSTSFSSKRHTVSKSVSSVSQHRYQKPE